ncbi:RNA polymerase sigma factor [Guggenheimella bovis]
MNQASFESWVQDHQKSLYNYILGYVSDSHDALDILQDSLISIFRSISSFRGDSSFMTFAIRIVKRRIADFYRDRKVTVELPETLEDSINEEKLELKHAVSKLTKEEERLLTLIFTLGLSYREISELENIPEGTVKSRFFTIKEKLKRELGETHV